MSRNAVSRKKAKEGLRRVVSQLDPKLFAIIESDSHMQTWEELVDVFVKGYGQQ